MSRPLLTAILVVYFCVIVSAENKTELYLLGLLGFSGAWPSGEATLIAAEMALEAVNSRQDILPGYKLTLLWNDTKVCRLHQGPRKVIKGGGGSMQIGLIYFRHLLLHFCIALLHLDGK